MRICDVHSHIFPQKIAAKAVASIGSFYGIPMERQGDPAELDALDEAAGVACSLVFSTATVPHQVQSINDYIATAVEQYPRFIGLGTLHQDMEAPEAEIQRILRLGLRGIKFHPDFQKMNIDDPAMVPVFREIAANRLPVLFHMGDTRVDYSHPRRLRKLLEQVPELTVIAAHFGGYSVWNEATQYLAGLPIYVDTSSSLPFLSPSEARELIRFYGAEHCLFGSDYPMWDVQRSLQEFLALGLSEKENAAILSGNFDRLFGL